MGKFKVLLVYPNLQMVMLLPSNIAVLSAYLKSHDIDVKLFDTTLYKMSLKSVDDIRVEHMQLRPFNLKDKGVDYKNTDVLEDFSQVVREYEPDLIGISVTDDTYELGLALAAKARNKDTHIIAGGVYPTFSPAEALANEDIDSICIGEGEEALLELCNKLKYGGDITGIKNIWVKQGGKIHRNDIRQPVDINILPFEDFDIFEEKRMFRPMQGKVHRMLPVSIDRGCPYSCAFCAAPVLRGLYSKSHKRQYFRVKTVNKVISELKHCVKKYKADYIYFNSETFFSRPDADIENFAKEYISSIGLPFWCQTRVETISEVKVRLLKEMNCDRISIGLEHGNEKFRKRILKKTFTNKQVVSAFDILDKSGISVTVNNIIGFPDETRELAFDTVRLNRSIRADSINAYFFTPYSGTPLRNYCIEKGYYKPDRGIINTMRDTILDMPRFPAEEIRGLVRTFPLYVKMPESYFERIRIAEKAADEGGKVFAELREIYYKKYF